MNRKIFNMSAFFIPHNCWHDWALLPKYLVSVQFILTGQVGGNSCTCTVHCKCLQYLQGLTEIHREPLQSYCSLRKKNVEWKAMGRGSVAIEELLYWIWTFMRLNAYLWSTMKVAFALESGINIQVRLLIFEVFSRGYVLIKGGYVYWFLIFKKLFKNF